MYKHTFCLQNHKIPMLVYTVLSFFDGYINFYGLFFSQLFVPDISVGIANRYGLDGPRIESRLGRDFPHLSRRGTHPVSYIKVT